MCFFVSLPYKSTIFKLYACLDASNIVSFIQSRISEDYSLDIVCRYFKNYIFFTYHKKKSYKNMYCILHYLILLQTTANIFQFCIESMSAFMQTSRLCEWVNKSVTFWTSGFAVEKSTQNLEQATPFSFVTWHTRTRQMRTNKCSKWQMRTR